MVKATIIATTIITAGILTNGSPAAAGPFDGGGTRTQIEWKSTISPNPRRTRWPYRPAVHEVTRVLCYYTSSGHFVC